MTERDRLKSLFEKLYNGEPWLDLNTVTVLENVTAAQAAERVLPDCNTIWEIVNHLINWRQNVLMRVQGEVIQTPTSNYFEPIKDTSRKAWTDTLLRLADTQKAWVLFLDAFEESQFETNYPVNQLTYYEHIHGIIQHDAYHLGQIVLLKKFIKK